MVYFQAVHIIVIINLFIAEKVVGDSMAKILKSKNNLTVGKDSYYNGNIFLKGRGQICIGSYCAIGENLKIIAGNKHNYNYPVMQVTFYKKFFSCKYPGAVPDSGVHIGNDVWFGDNCTLLDGTIIGDGCVVAAGAVVKGQFPPYSIIGGVPSKILKERFSRELSKLLTDIKWWDWDDKKIQRNFTFFSTNIAELTTEEVLNLIID